MSDKPPTLRARQAQFTRDEILQAARRLFAANGYTRTSMRDIADAAGVSAQTVYDSIGSKQTIVARLNDLIEDEADVRSIAAKMDSGDVEQIIVVQAKVIRAILENCGDIIRAVVSGAAAEPELAVVATEGRRRHVDGAQRIVMRLQEMGALAPGLDSDEAARTLSASSDAAFALLLQDDYGWTLDRIETWMVDLHRRMLLGRA